MYIVQVIFLWDQLVSVANIQVKITGKIISRADSVFGVC